MLGKKVKDTLTGVRGVAIARIEYMNGCVQYQIQTDVVKDGIPAEAQWFDVQRVELIKASTPKTARKRAGTGGPPPKTTPQFGK